MMICWGDVRVKMKSPTRRLQASDLFWTGSRRVRAGRGLAKPAQLADLASSTTFSAIGARLRLDNLVWGDALEGVSGIHDQGGVSADQLEVKRGVIGYQDDRILRLDGLSRQG